MNYKIISILSYVVAAIFIGLGFHKMFVYENPESYLLDSVNTYVGGDAYNYIINANYATGYFVLALLFVVLGSTFLLINSLEKKRDEIAFQKENNLEPTIKSESEKQDN